MQEDKEARRQSKSRSDEMGQQRLILAEAVARAHEPPSAGGESFTAFGRLSPNMVRLFPRAAGALSPGTYLSSRTRITFLPITNTTATSWLSLDIKVFAFL